MKCTIPEISWHNRDPVLSVDIHPVSNDFYKLASGGGDCHVLIWHLVLSKDGSVQVDAVSDLTRHQKAVNAVRWSPSGQYLATADDDANIIIWQLKTDNVPLLEGETNDKETWIIFKILRGHKEDVYDICWSVNDSKLLSGSVDNTAIIWDVTKGKMDLILSDHKGFVQGVAWDPKNQIIATIGTDRICRIFDVTGKHIKSRIMKGKLPVSPEHYLYDKEVKYFYDDTFKSFYRRLQFSPDGSLLICPSGHIEAEDSKKTLSATLIFTLDNWTSPAAILPLKSQCSTVIRCCPTLFELHEEGPDPIVKLPYRMIIAVATDHDVILYDTQQLAPFAWLQQIHYTRLTDLTWSPDGQLLTASSTDGFCSLITFDKGELGIPYVKEDSETEENPLNVSGVEELEEDETVDVSNKDKEEQTIKQKRNSFLHQWAKGSKPTKITESPNVNDVKSDTKATNSPVNKLNPKRIQPVKIQSPAINKLIPKRVKPMKTDESSKKSLQKTDSTNKLDTNNPDENPLNISGVEELEADENVDVNNKDKEGSEQKNNSFLDQWTKEPKTTEFINGDNDKNDKKTTVSPIVNKLTPKRIQPTKIVNSTNTPSKKNETSKLETNKLTSNESCLNNLTPKKSEIILNKVEIHSPSTKNKINILTPRKTKLNYTKTINEDLNSPKSTNTINEVTTVEMEVDILDKNDDKTKIDDNAITPKKTGTKNKTPKSNSAKNTNNNITETNSEENSPKNKTKKGRPIKIKLKDPVVTETPKKVKLSDDKNKTGPTLLQWFGSGSPKNVKPSQASVEDDDDAIEIIEDADATDTSKKVKLSDGKNKGATLLQQWFTSGSPKNVKPSQTSVEDDSDIEIIEETDAKITTTQIKKSKKVVQNSKCDDGIKKEKTSKNNTEALTKKTEKINVLIPKSKSKVKVDTQAENESNTG